jgi:chromosomal replication initiator protein
MNLERIWTETMALLEKRVNRQSYDTWIKPLALDGVSDHEARILIPNRFFEEWLREHYYTQLREAVSEATGMGNLEIQFVLAGGEAGEMAGEAPQQRTVRIARSPALNPRYSFDTFVVGSCNQFAHAACMAVAESLAKAYNPLFIYGGVGLGKTHLLHALGNGCYHRSPGAKIAYVSSEQFTNEVINSIRYDRMTEFRNKYRSVDMLLIDDIQFIAGKERTQEEFFHTFNTLYEARKQIVLSSDRYPKEMPTLEERLRSRFEWGLIADLQPPDLETKIAILKRKAESEGILLPDEVSFFLATCIKTNVRELEGSLIRLGAFSSLTGQPINIELTKKVLRDAIEERKRFVSVDEIQKAVADRFHIKPAELKSKRRTKALVLPRQITMYLCREITKMSYPEIGRQFGGKDHTTVMHACRRIEKQTASDGSVKQIVETMMQHFRR